MPSEPADQAGETGLDAQHMLRDLRNQVAAMRDRLEAAEANQQAAIARATAQAVAESALLRSTVTALREELERRGAAAEKAAADARAGDRAEIAHLQETITKLREELESVQPAG